MNKTAYFKLIITASLLFPFTYQNAHAAGFALNEISTSGLGNAFAGGAASAEDASTVFANPAGMIYLPNQQLVFATHALDVSAKFNNQGSVPAAGRSLGGDGGDPGSWALVPNIYYSTRLTPKLAAGIALNAPFGLKTEYNKDWVGRFQAIKSDLRTYNINPAIAYQVSDSLSLGLGISLMKAQAELTQAVNFGPAGEGSARIKGDDWSYGYNLGAILQITPESRIGIVFRSQIKQTLDADASFRRPPGVPFAAAPDGKVSADLTLPASLSLSAFSQLNEQWDLMADVTWTGWNRFQQLKIVRDNGSVLSATPENWENSLRYSIGSSYRYNATWKLRAGLAYDQDPIKDEFRTARIPSNDRIWLAIGANYRLSDKTCLDMGYAHLFLKSTPIDINQGPAAGRVSGSYDIQINVLSLQLTHNF